MNHLDTRTEDPIWIGLLKITRPTPYVAKNIIGMVTQLLRKVDKLSSTMLVLNSILVPYLSISHPTSGAVMEANNPPALAAPTIIVRLQPRSLLIG
jgi:hypothetical protein